MFKKIDFKKIFPHLIALVIFILIAMWFFNPALKGFSINQNDIQQGIGMGNDIAGQYELEKVDPMWTNGMFSGMPANQISIKEHGNLNKPLRKALYLWLPDHIGQLFLLMAGFFFMACCLRINVWVSTVGAIAFAFSTFLIISIEAGHVNKVWAIIFMAPLVGSFVLTYRGYLKWGLILSAFFMSKQLYSNHVQITYYTAIILSILGVYYLVKSIKKGTLKNFIIGTIGLFAVYILGAAGNAASLLLTSEYTAETTRGTNQVTITPNNEPIAKGTSGLDRDYIVSWSLGKSETATLFNPYAKGGHSIAIGGGELAEKLKDADDFNNEQKQFIAQNVQYYGDQPFTSGPVYIGALVFVLALLGLFFIKSGVKWAFFAIALLSLFLAWGKNMMWFSDLFIDFVPLYSKFRAVTMILVVLELVMPVLMILLLQQLYEHREEILKYKIPFAIGVGALTLIMGVLAFAPNTIGMTSEAERERMNSLEEVTRQQIVQQVAAMPAEQLIQYGVADPNDEAQVNQLITMATQNQVQSFENNLPALLSFRKMIYTDYGKRSLMFIILGLGVILLYMFIPKIPKLAFVGALGALIAIDLIPINLIYMPNTENDRGEYDKWLPWEEQRYPHSPKSSDNKIMEAEMQINPKLAEKIKQLEKTARNFANDQNWTSLGVSRYVDNEKFRALTSATRYRVADLDDQIFNSARTSFFHESIGGYHGAKLKRYQNLIDFGYLPFDRAILNMMNVKYIVRDGNVEINPGAMGTVWLANDLYIAENENDEILKLGKTYSLKKEITDYDLLVNDQKIEAQDVFAGERIFLVKDKDSLKIQWPDGLAKGDTAYFVRDVNGRTNWVPKIALDSDNLNSFTTLLSLVVKENFNAKNLTILPKEFADKVNEKNFSGEGKIELTAHKLDHLTYTYTSNDEQLAVFSEMYYKPGWKAYVDGKEAEILRVNYVLRGLLVPAGKHEIVFKVNKDTHSQGVVIARISSWLIYLLLIGGLVHEFLKRREKEKKTA